MKKYISILMLFVFAGMNAAFADFDKENLNNLGKHFADCTPYKSPAFPNGKHGIAQQEIFGYENGKCHYQEYGYFGPQRKKITEDCYFSKDDLKVLGTVNSKNHAAIMIPYLNDPYSCKRKEN